MIVVLHVADSFIGEDGMGCDGDTCQPKQLTFDGDGIGDIRAGGGGGKDGRRHFSGAQGDKPKLVL